MAEYDNTNRGALFKNDDKKTPNHPDFSGNVNVDGVEFFIDGWRKESKGGKAFISLSVKQKTKQGDAPAPKKAPARVELDDEVPF